MIIIETDNLDEIENEEKDCWEDLQDPAFLNKSIFLQALEEGELNIEDGSEINFLISSDVDNFQVFIEISNPREITQRLRIDSLDCLEDINFRRFAAKQYQYELNENKEEDYTPEISAEYILDQDLLDYFIERDITITAEIEN